ncbi:hypothetical protein HPP92_024209 [Vanilla planifolia]|uniref:Protein kinase domain-containing protein n=1 Tax=Vanilla planifolia TaxID=51239 RepID=A0A835PQA9_VANPL|nr:hypothetical protein HPP92_024209 [Vanilla planifolia]
MPGKSSCKLSRRQAIDTPHRRPIAFRKRHKFHRWVAGFFIGCLAGIISGFVGSFLFRILLNFVRGRYRDRRGFEIFSPVIKSKEVLSFLEKENGLTDLEVIGHGGCGEVYRKELGTKTIAIKMIRLHSGAQANLTEEESRMLDKWTRQIRSEIRTVGRIRHRNLLPLLAHISRPERHYLVYEYMKNGSLHDALRESAEGTRKLQWAERYRVAAGIAAGLEHLHVHHRPHVIHRDLKPANVLLDDAMEPRIADFGFAKEVPDANTHITSSNIAGTLGYIAPEYYQTMKYTVKCDVFSFGVILGALVTGRFPSDEAFAETEEMSMLRWIRNRMSEGNAAACFDRQLVGEGNEDQMELMLRVACFCTADDPNDRPNSKELRIMLAQIPATG